jgi:hypothetical protein
MSIKRMKVSRLSLHSIRSADPRGWWALAGLRFFAELKAEGPLQRAAESNIDSALQLVVLCRIVEIFLGDSHTVAPRNTTMKISVNFIHSTCSADPLSCSALAGPRPLAWTNAADPLENTSLQYNRLSFATWQ